MDNSLVEWFAHWNTFDPSEENMNPSVTITINTTTFIGSSTLISPQILIDIDLNTDLNQEDIECLLEDELTDPVWFCPMLASYILYTATELGFSCNGYITINITNRTVVVSPYPPPPPSNNEETSLEDKTSKMVLEGKLDREELKRLEKVETELCAICLDNLFDSSKHGDVTRMTCSHVFHEQCLSKWLHKENTCPLCRTVL